MGGSGFKCHQVELTVPAKTPVPQVPPPRDVRAAAALRESEQRLRAIVDTAVDAIITIDHRGMIESANASTQRIFGYSPQELIGHSVNVLMPQPYSAEHDGYLRRYLVTGQGRIIGTGREVVGLRKDGSRFPIHLSISEVPLVRGRLFTAIIHDVTERRRLEREVLEASAKEQRRIGRELHDGVCQNLVGAALGISVLAKRLARESPAAAAEAEKLAKLVRQTATQARNLSHGLAPLEVSSNGLTMGLEKLAQQVTATCGIRCDFECDYLLPAYDTATANHLYRIVQEAVNNAIRHGKATQVQVRLRGNARESILTARDNGVGFAQTPGEGLGLRTMAYRARVIGGALSIEPADGGGTVIRCVFHANPV
jgi:PAS domain S-box-containing protein